MGDLLERILASFASMNYKIRVAAFIFLLLASSLGAQCSRQSTTGTVVVIGWSQTRIAIAVDSRGFDDANKYRDDVCKIVRLDNHSIFTAARVLGRTERSHQRLSRGTKGQESAAIENRRQKLGRPYGR